MQRTASSRPLEISGGTKAQLLIILGFRKRSAVPAALRTSVGPKFFALPALITSSLLAFNPCGWWTNAASNGLLVTSPLESNSAAALSSAVSRFASLASFFCFSPWSTATTTRHSLSTSAALPIINFVSMISLFFNFQFRRFWQFWQLWQSFYPLFLDRAIASLASRSAVRRRSVSRLSHICLPRASAISHFIFPFLKYMRVGTRV